MVKKIEVAVNSRTDPNFQIIARTDARTTLGLDEALRRGEAYAKAGADILFIESPESVDEMQKICQTFRGTPLIANMVEKGRTPVLSKEDLEKLGYKIAIFPVTALLASVQAMTKVYEQFKTTGSSVDQAVELYDFGDLSKLMGFEDVWEFEKKFVETK
jgi:2-methylisocitrate lyase-like PEP mutase family enzyme